MTFKSEDIVREIIQSTNRIPIQRRKKHVVASSNRIPLALSLENEHLERILRAKFTTSNIKYERNAAKRKP